MLKKLSFGFCLCLMFVGLQAAASDWPHFRGPSQDGRAPGAAAMGTGAFGLKVDWKRPLGSGYSSISVVGNTGVVMYTDGTSDLLGAFDPKTGVSKWNYTIGPMYKGHSGSQDGPTGTPTIDGDLVFALDPHGELVAVTLGEGKKVWSHKLEGDVTAKAATYGFNTVPTVVDSTLIVMTGAEKGFTFTGFDRTSGKVLWHSGEDTGAYQSPFIWEQQGRKRVLAVTDNYFVELNPKDGHELWRQKHDLLNEESFALPLPLGNDQFLVVSYEGGVAYQLKGEGDKTELSELWRTPVFQRTYAIPVYLDGYIYGFKDLFLHCLDAKTGAIKWRSRPPGGRGLILVDHSLMIVSNDGSLVAVAASPEGYKEQARLEVFEGDSYTPPAFADGSFFIRDLKEMARVSISKDAVAETKQSGMPELKGSFGQFVASLMKSPEKKAMLDGYFASHTQFPLIEAGGLVHYIYRGEAKDLALARANQEEKPMYHVPETDLWFVSETLGEADHWSYVFSEFGDNKVDPLNPLVLDKTNELRMPKWVVPSYLAKPGPDQGTMVDQAFKGRSGKERTLKVYLPFGYDKGTDRYPLILVPGIGGIDRGEIKTVLDNLSGKDMKPTLVVFVDITRGDMADLASVADEVALDLVPFLDKTFRTIADPSARSLVGCGREGNAATYIFGKHPELASKLGVQGFLYFPEQREAITKLMDAKFNGKSAFVVHSSNDIQFPGYNAVEDSKALAEQLKKGGFKLEESHNAGAAGWANWRAQLGLIYIWASPK